MCLHTQTKKMAQYKTFVLKDPYQGMIGENSTIRVGTIVEGLPGMGMEMGTMHPNGTFVVARPFPNLVLPMSILREPTTFELNKVQERNAKARQRSQPRPQTAGNTVAAAPVATVRKIKSTYVVNTALQIIDNQSGEKLKLGEGDVVECTCEDRNGAKLCKYMNKWDIPGECLDELVSDRKSSTLATSDGSEIKTTYVGNTVSQAPGSMDAIKKKTGAVQKTVTGGIIGGGLGLLVSYMSGKGKAICIIGGAVLGMATGYYLNRSGMEFKLPTKKAARPTI